MSPSWGGNRGHHDIGDWEFARNVRDLRYNTGSIGREGDRVMERIIWLFAVLIVASVELGIVQRPRSR